MEGTDSEHGATSQDVNIATKLTLVKYASCDHDLWMNLALGKLLRLQSLNPYFNFEVPDGTAPKILVDQALTIEANSQLGSINTSIYQALLDALYEGGEKSLATQVVQVTRFGNGLQALAKLDEIINGTIKAEVAMSKLTNLVYFVLVFDSAPLQVISCSRELRLFFDSALLGKLRRLSGEEVLSPCTENLVRCLRRLPHGFPPEVEKPPLVRRRRLGSVFESSRKLCSFHL